MDRYLRVPLLEVERVGPGGRRRSMERLVLRRVVLLGAPFALALLEIFHPERRTAPARQ
jgi:hypothetical protein